MNKNLTEVVLIVDESGSMQFMRNDTIGHINKFISEQKALPGEANFTLVFFDDKYRVIFDGKNIKDVTQITERDYSPTGSTALRDAVGKTINSVGNRLKDMNESDRPEKIIFAILTDGQENSSKEFTQEQLKNMITHQESKYSWKFLFLAENIDSKATAINYGINPVCSFQNPGGSAGYDRTYNIMSNTVSSFRSTGNLNDLNGVKANE